jgi:probable HAF family extracellular repeat protein
VRSASGSFTAIDVPGANGTEAYGINAGGQIVGFFLTSGGKTHGYVRSASGIFTTIDVPGANGTEAHGINNGGQIVGDFTDSAGRDHGFVTKP